MPKEKYKAETVIAAIKDANGILAQAARMLGCSRATVYNYTLRYPTVKAAFDEANETNIDFVESKLMENIRSGNIAAQIFFLKTKAKHRGYVERQELDISRRELDDAIERELARVAGSSESEDAAKVAAASNGRA